MAFKDLLLPEFDREMSTTRRVLERVPGERLGWKPHEKSMSLGRLATHLAELPRWSRCIIEEPEVNLEPGAYRPAEEASRAEILQLFDANVASARAALAPKTDAELMETWTLKNDGERVFTVPKITALRSFLMNHVIHHRGQLSVYLRLLDVPVPPMYGPTADERA